MTTDARIVHVGVLPRSDRGGRRFDILADTDVGRLSVMLTEGQEGWQGRFPDPVPPRYVRRAVIDAFGAWLASHQRP